MNEEKAKYMIANWRPSNFKASLKIWQYKLKKIGSLTYSKVNQTNVMIEEVKSWISFGNKLEVILAYINLPSQVLQCSQIYQDRASRGIYDGWTTCTE